MLEARASRKWQPCSVPWSQKGLPEWIQEHVSGLPSSRLFSPSSPGMTGHLLAMQRWPSDSLLLLLFSSFLLTILFTPFFHPSHAFQKATLKRRRTRSGMIKPLGSHIPGFSNRDSCPDLSQRVHVVPWEHGPNPSIAGRGVSASEKTRRMMVERGWVLGSCVLSSCVTISLQRSQLPANISHKETTPEDLGQGICRPDAVY